MVMGRNVSNLVPKSLAQIAEEPSGCAKGKKLSTSLSFIKSFLVTNRVKRPIGPDGESTMKSGVRSEWKCNYFKWASDV